jgi:hypothetical protein
LNDGELVYRLRIDGDHVRRADKGVWSRLRQEDGVHRLLLEVQVP